MKKQAEELEMAIDTKCHARLSFWVPCARMHDFATEYEERLVPLLKKHGLVESSERGRAVVAGVFSRLFELETPGEIAAKEQTLEEDPAWTGLLGKFATAYEVDRADDLLQFSLRLYSTPAGSGRTVEMGSGVRQGLWQSFSLQDGLPDTIVFDILQDRKGHLWFGTLRGVSFFDGAQFTTFNVRDGLVHNQVLCIGEDQAGNLWLGTLEGVSRFDGAQFTTFNVEDGLADNRVWTMLEDRAGNLWFGTGAGASLFDGAQFTTFNVEDILDNTFANVTDFTNDYVDAGLDSNRVLSIAEDRAGNLWFGTRSGVSRFDGENFSGFTSADGLAGTWIQSIFVDRAGQVWFGADYGGGVSRYDGEKFTTFTADDGLANNTVISIAEDPAGNLWFGSYGSGVSRYDRAQFTTYTTDDGLVNNGVLSMLQDQAGNLWFGTFENVSLFDGKSFTTFTTQDGLVGTGVHVIYEDRTGQLWFGTAEGLSLFDGERFTTFTIDDGLATNAVWTMLEDRQGNLWFGGAGRRIGTTRYDKKSFTIFNAEDGLAYKNVMGILQDKAGNLWFATEGGVSLFDGKKFTNFTTRDGLASNSLTSLLEDRAGNLWFGTIGGVSRYDGKCFTSFTSEEGLIHNNVECMLEDQKGHLWFGTYGGGISRYDGFVFQTLSKKDGLVHDTVQQILQDPQGPIWIATEGGITRYQPCDIPPAIRIANVSADRHYGPVREIHLPASQKLVVFEFQGSSFTTILDSMAYVYRLKGHEIDWQTTRARRVEYEDLELGEYTFQVKAVDRDLNYSELASVEVSMLPDPRIEALNQALSAVGIAGEFVGKSPALLQVLEQLAEVAPSEVSVFISGETGTGKGLAARTVHGLSPRQARPFIQVNCGAIPASLVESELFGHERGAFTGAVARKLGKIELADGGTLFLDEIGDLSFEAQVKLLRFLDEHAFERVGSTRTINPDVRVIAATNRDLRQMVEAGQFREDLYFRLRIFPVQLPPLNKRREDIPLLAVYFMQEMAAHLHKEVTQLTPEALHMLQAYDWPGNVRELEHTIQRAVIVCRGTAIQAEDIAQEPEKAEDDPLEELVPLETFERRYICRVLERTGWLIGGAHGAAAVLGLNVSTLRGRMRKLGIERP